MLNAFTIRALTVTDVHDYRTIRLAALRCAPAAFGEVHDIEALNSITQPSFY